MTTMTRDQAIQHITTAGGYVELLHKDATLTHRVRTACWLDGGCLVMAHPTDPQRGPVAAPLTGRYRAPSPEQLEEERVFWAEQERADAEAAALWASQAGEIYGNE